MRKKNENLYLHSSHTLYSNGNDNADSWLAVMLHDDLRGVAWRARGNCKLVCLSQLCTYALLTLSAHKSYCTGTMGNQQARHSLD